MLGHLVSTGHNGASNLDTRPAPAMAYPLPQSSRQPGWFARLFTQIFQKR
jgi:hypothetical protein